MLKVASYQDMDEPQEHGAIVEWNRDECIERYFKNLDALEFQASVKA